MKPRTRRPARDSAPRPARRRQARGAARPRGRQARRPGVPLRRRLPGRLPIGRLLAALAAAGIVAVTVALLNAPWLRVTDVASTGERYTEVGEIQRILEQEHGASLLAVDTRALGERLERIPSVAGVTVSALLTGRLEARVVDREVAFVWETSSARFLGAADGTIFASRGLDAAAADLDGVPQVRDERFAARLVTVGDVIPVALVRTAMQLAEPDPLMLGSDADALAIRLDDEYGFRLLSEDPAWELALGVYGLDPRETPEAADARLERQVTAVRTLFASRPEAEIGWVDVRNPGKVYFRAKG